ncbi:MAG: RDD family protein [Candidatus Dormibacteria bacterium]
MTSSTPTPLRGGATNLPSGERLAAGVVDFLVLIIPEAILFVLVADHSVGLLLKYIRAHEKSGHIVTGALKTAQYHHLAVQTGKAVFLFIIVTQALTAVYLIGMYLARGATVGKLAMGLRITRADGQPMRPANAALRSMVFWIPALLIVIPYGTWIWILVTIASTVLILARPDHRGLDDMIGGTIVVRKESVGRPLADLLGFSPSQVPPGSPPAPGHGGHLPGWEPVEQPPAPTSPPAESGSGFP